LRSVLTALDSVNFSLGVIATKIVPARLPPD
jgi:hypothetical protein